MADGGIIEKLLIQIGVDSKGVEQGATQAVQRTATALKSAVGMFVMPVFTALLSGQFIKQTYDEVINLDHLSTSLGVNVERLQMWQGAAKDAGSSAEAVGALWQRMNAQIADAAINGTGTLKEFADKGVLPALTTIDGKIKDTDTYLLEMADAFKNMDAQTASGIGRRLGIRDFNLMNFFQQGSGEINQQLKHIKDLGVYTQRDVEIAREFDVALNDVSRVMKMSVVPIFRLVTPIISKLGMGLVYLRQHARAFIPAAVGLAAIITTAMIPSIKELGKQLWKLFTNPAFLKAALIVGVLAAIGLAIEDIMVWMEGGDSVIGEYLGSWEEFKPTIQPIIDLFNAFVTQLNAVWDAFGELIDIIKAFPENASTAFGQTKDAIYNQFVEPVIKWFDDLMNKIRDFFSFLGTIGSTIAGIGSSVGGLLARGNAGNIDNSNRNTSVVQNNTFNGVTGATDAANRLMGNNPVPAANTAY